MNKYNIVSIFFRFDFGHISILTWFSSMISHKAQLYATHIVVLNACVLAHMHLKIKANTLMNNPLIMNKIHYICWK
jgi:hypothetical protein